MDANQNISTKEWMELITKEVNKSLGATLGGNFIAATYPDGFYYAMKEQYYNADSLRACLVS